MPSPTPAPSVVPETPDVTVVVMTRDRWPDLSRSLGRHRVPVIVVDNGSRDGTPERIRAEFPGVSVVRLGANRGAVARNVGVALARTPYVAFADDDSWWEPGALARAAAVLDAHRRLAVLAGRTLVGASDLPDAVTTAMAAAPHGREPDLPGPTVHGFLACGAVVRRSAYLAAGGFDDVVQFGGEEERLSLDLDAAGWGQAYVADVVAHHHPSTARDHARRQVRDERNRLLTALMRRPWPAVARTAWTLARGGPTGRRGLVRALPRLPRALACRQSTSSSRRRTTSRRRHGGA